MEYYGMCVKIRGQFGGGVMIFSSHPVCPVDQTQLLSFPVLCLRDKETEAGLGKRLLPPVSGQWKRWNSNSHFSLEAGLMQPVSRSLAARSSFPWRTEMEQVTMSPEPVAAALG